MYVKYLISSRDIKELSERSTTENDQLNKIKEEIMFIRKKLEKYQTQINAYEVSFIWFFF